MLSLCIPATAAEEQADMAILGIISDIPEPQAGDDVVFTVEYANLGNLSNESFVIFLFVDETLEGEMDVFPLDVGEEASADFLFHIGEDMEIGEHSVIAMIDASGQVPETDESNNEFTDYFFVSGNEEPDLFVGDILWMPESPKTGGEVNFSVIYGNQGTRSAGKGFDISLYVDDSQVASEWVDDLQSGESSSYECSWTVDGDVPEGEHTVVAYIHMENENGDSEGVGESDETNNEFSKTFQVSKELPDLLIRDISRDPFSPKTGDEVTFSVSYANQGSLAAGRDFYICLYVDDFLVGSELLGDLPPGESGVCELPWTVDREVMDGKHTLTAYIDMEDRDGYSAYVEESDETNNEFTQTFQVTGQQPDLVVQDIAWKPESPETGDEVTFSVSYANQGSLAAGRDFYVCLYVDGIRVGSEPVADLQAGESAVYESSWVVDGNVPVGEHELTAYVDMEDKDGYSAAVEESLETNNEFSKTFQVSGGEPESDVEPESEGEPESDVKPESDVEPESDVKPESEEKPGNKEKPESEGVPDLVIEEITWNPASPKTEEEVTFSVKYGNEGSLSSGKDFYICLYVDESRLGYEKVPALQAGESAVYECSWKVDRDVEGGGHQVKAYIDMKDKDGYSEYVEEESEANNDFSGTVDVERSHSSGKLEISVADDSSGEPVEGVEVYLDNTFVGSTDLDGFIRSEAAQGETHILNVMHPDYFESMKELVMGYDEVTGVKMEIVCAKVPLTLGVEDSSGLPVSDAEVFIGNNFTGSTDFEGVLEIQLLQESDVVVRVEKETYYPTEGHIHVGNMGGFYTLTLKQEDPRAPTIEVFGFSEIGDGDSILEDGEKLELDYRVSDESGIETVLVKIDGSSIDTFHEEGTYKTVMGPLSAGEHLIEIEASDLDENEHKNLKEIPLEVSDKGPSVAFQCTKQEINVGETAVFDLGVMNPLGGKTMNVQLVVRPPSGVSVSGSYFATSGGGMYQAEYTLEPGSDVRIISLEMIGNEEGIHDVEADVFYSFEEDKSYSQHDTLSLDVKASDSPFSSGGSRGSVKGFIPESVESFISKAPAFTGLIFIFVVLLLLIFSIRNK